MKDKRKIRWVVIFFVFFILSFAVRGIYPSADAPFDLSWSQGPSTDAAYYLAPVVNFVKTGVLEPISKVWNAPGYYIMYIPTLFLFGVGYAQANLTTVAISLLGFIFFFLILKRMGDEKALISASIFWAFTYIWAMYNRIPIIYTVMIAYMLFAAYLWYVGTKRPVFFILAWIILIFTILFVRVIAVALVFAFLLGHLVLYTSKTKSKGSNVIRWAAIITLSAVAFVVVILLGRFFDISPIDVAMGRVKAHLREDVMGSSLLFYLFNFGASGGIIERLPIVSILAYTYIIIFIKDAFAKRFDFKNSSNVMKVVFLSLFVLGALFTILFKYAPTRYFLFLLPPMFILAGLAISRFIEPKERTNLGYGYYIILIVWLVFLIFKILLSLLFYFIRNYSTFVLGFNLSEKTAELFGAVINFFSSFYLLISASLILSVLIMAVIFLVDKTADRREKKFLIRKSVRIVLAAVIFVLFFYFQGKMYVDWAKDPRYTLSETSHALGEILGPDAKLSGTYAHPLTMENDLHRHYMTFFRPNETPPCYRFENWGATHLIIDAKNGLGYIQANYPDTFDCLKLIETFYIRGNAIDLYAYTGAEDYTPTDYERARLSMASGDFASAEKLLVEFIEKTPDTALPYVSLARCRMGRGDIAGAEEALKKALAIDPDNMMAHWGMGQVCEFRGDLDGALSHYKEALALYPESNRIKEKIEEIISMEK